MRALVLATFVLVSIVPAVASADEVERCVEASERGQSARRRKALIEARSAFIECSAETCPGVVRTTCSEWLAQVESILPTVVIAAVGSDDKDVPSATITLDGRESSEGTTLAVDPGTHTVVARASGYRDTTVDFSARESERVRIVTVRLPRVGSSGGSDRDIRPITWVTGGLAAVALGSFAFFGATGLSKADDLRSSCAPFCSESERSSVATRYVVADISLVAAVVLGGVSVWTLLHRPSAPGTNVAR